MSIVDINKNKTVNENNIENYPEIISSNLNSNIINPDKKEDFVNDLFSIKDDENNNISSPKSNFNLHTVQSNMSKKIIVNDSNKYKSENNKSKNNDDISISNFSSNENILRIEFANKLFDEISVTNSVNQRGIIEKKNNEIYTFPEKIESDNRVKEIKNKYSVNNKIEEDGNEIKEENISYINSNDGKNNKNFNKNDNTFNINQIPNNINNFDPKKDIENININKINNFLQEEINVKHNENIINGINKNENNLDILNNLNNMNNLNNNNNNNQIEVNESISIGEIDLDALPKFNNNINIKENIDKKIDNENMKNEDLKNNLNINEHINNMNLAHKLKHDNKKKKQSKYSKSKQAKNYYEYNEDNSNIPLDKNKNNILDVFQSFSNKNNTSNKEKFKNKEKNSNKILYIKKHINENKDSEKNNKKRNSNNHTKLSHMNSIGRNSIEKNFKSSKKSQRILSSKNNNDSYFLNDSEIIENNKDNGNPKFLTVNLEDINNDRNNKKKFKESSNNNLAKICINSTGKEISYFDFLKKNNLFNNYNENDIFVQSNNDKRKKILNNLYFSDYILKEETIFDKIKKYNISEPLPVLYQYEDIIKSYEDNKKDFLLLFQYINDKEKDHLYQKYKEIQYNKTSKFKINTCVNDYSNFKKIFKKNDKNNLNINNFEYIRFINETNGDSFYRSFIFNYIEIQLINKKIKEISMLIIDIFKMYDLDPSIFINDYSKINIKNVLICFNIIFDFVKVDLWDRAYIFFLAVYNNELDKALINYMKYNIFLYLSKIDFIINIDNKNKSRKKKHHRSHNNDNNNFKDEFIFDHLGHLIEHSEPSKIIFQCMTFIFGVSLNIFYFENEAFENNLNINNIFFTNHYKNEENENNIVNLIFCYDNYHICYMKNFINANGNDKINKALLDIFVNNTNKLCPISKNINILSKYTFCQICNKNCSILEIKDDFSNNSENIIICDQCLYLQIDDHLIQRNNFLYEEKFKNFIYYLQPISLELCGQKEKNNIFKFDFSNSDYINLYNKTFNERISEVMHTVCLQCFKRDNLIKIECGCEICFNCIKILIMEKTKNKIILNIYEKKKLEKKNFHCPICHKGLNIDNFISIFKQNGMNLDYFYNDALQRLKKICQKKCLFCLKKINKIEVESNKMKNHFKFSVKKTIENDNDFIDKEENLKEQLDCCEDNHLICFNCYKILNKIKKGIKKEENMYKKIFCNICNIEHFIDMKEWQNLGKAKSCCKCEIF